MTNNDLTKHRRDEERIPLKDIILHELGHCIVAKVLGYNPTIDINPNAECSFTRHEQGDGNLENYITIALGGIVAEKITGIETFGWMNDLGTIFRCLKDLHQSRGINFPHTRVLDMPYGAYRKYEDRCRKIISKAGGKDLLENATDYLLAERNKTNTQREIKDLKEGKTK